MGKVRIPYSHLEYLLELLAVAGAIAGASLVILRWPHLPETVPQHYNFAGTVDAWGGRGTLLALPIINISLYVFLSLIRVFAPLSSGDSNRVRSVKLGMELLGWIKAWAIWSFAYLIWVTVEIAQGRATALSPAFLAVMVGFGLAITGLHCFLIFRSLEPRE